MFLAVFSEQGQAHHLLRDFAYSRFCFKRHLTNRTTINFSFTVKWDLAASYEHRERAAEKEGSEPATPGRRACSEMRFGPLCLLIQTLFLETAAQGLGPQQEGGSGGDFQFRGRKLVEGCRLERWLVTFGKL